MHGWMVWSNVATFGRACLVFIFVLRLSLSLVYLTLSLSVFPLSPVDYLRSCWVKEGRGDDSRGFFCRVFVHLDRGG